MQQVRDTARIDGDTRDEDALAAIAAGDSRALGAIYDRHAAAMLRVALRFLRSRQDAEDLLHDVFVEVCGKAADYEAKRGDVRRWLLMRVRSRAIDRLRSLDTARRHAMAEARAQEPATAPCATWDSVDRERARHALQSLPEGQRTLVMLSYFEGLTCAEMAERCGIPIGTVKSRLSAAIGKLRHSIAAPGGLL